jgi:hypothetical protein
VSDLEITYAAQTSACTFLLDADGICRRIVMTPPTPSRRPASSKRDVGRSAARCVGAQYVASLDPAIAGMLTDMPRVGAAMLFARVDERGRVSLVRTGVVTHFERHQSGTEDPFVESESLPSVSVETSAPVLTPKLPNKTPVPPPRLAQPEADPYEDEEDIERTQPIQALSPKALRSLRNPSLTTSPSRVEQPLDDLDTTNDDSLEDDDSLDTAEYHSTAGSSPEEAMAEQLAWSSGHDLPAPATLRQVPKLLPTGSDELEYATTNPTQPVRRPIAPFVRQAPIAPTPRRSEPQVVTRRSEGERTPRTSVAGRGRGER